MNNNNWDHIKRGVVSAGAAVSEQIFFGSFLDMLKLEKQRNINNSYAEIGKTFFQQKGLRALTLGVVLGELLCIPGVVFASVTVTVSVILIYHRISFQDILKKHAE